eukprot:s1441_g16.t1
MQLFGVGVTNQEAFHRDAILPQFPRANSSQPAARPVSVLTGQHDQTNTVTLRRQLLSPRLQIFGASRLRETCVIWTTSGTGETADDEDPPSSTSAALAWLSVETEIEIEIEEWAQRDETDFVVFPPYGVCPLELLGGHALPTWTIMPNSHRFQPTHALQVRMWRVKLLRREEDTGGSEEFSHGRTKSASKSLDGEAPCDALRLEDCDGL